MDRLWDIREVESIEAESLARELGIPDFLGRLLLLRGVKNAKEAKRFLAPDLADLHDPFTMKDMQKAVERILKSLLKKEKVCVWGDYDVDGITSTSVLLLFLRQVGLDVVYHIPSRLEEGYGLNEVEIDRIYSEGSSLLITVDCGVSDFKAIEHARSIGLDVLVLDHHQVPDELPPAIAVLNPHRKDCSFETEDLAAVGVVFNLVMALRAKLRTKGFFGDADEPNLRELMDLVALGTVADIVPLLGENRTITYFGLKELSAARRPGVAALKEVSGLRWGDVSAGQVAFRLAPRINAAGRLGSASNGVDLLTTKSYSKALRLARLLDEANVERQGIEQQIYEQAMRQAADMLQGQQPQSLVLSSDNWHVGVVGIVASRLVEQFGCPVVLVSLDGQEGRGSARGVTGTHLYEAMASCSQYLVTFGGHRMAAGLTIMRENLDDFRRSFANAILKQKEQGATGKVYSVDAQVQPSSWTPSMVRALLSMAPFGLGNPEPVFLAKNLLIRSARTVGKEPPYHLKAVASEGGSSWDVIGFRMGQRLSEVEKYSDILYTPEFNTWDGQTSIQLRLLDFRPT